MSDDYELRLILEISGYQFNQSNQRSIYSKVGRTGKGSPYNLHSFFAEIGVHTLVCLAKACNSRSISISLF